MTQFSYGQLEGLWIEAGGPKGLAPIMAAIAEAESSGNSQAQNPSGATGLWQILGNPFPGNAFDPLTNARMAVAKWRTQGLGAWATWPNPAQGMVRGNVTPIGPGKDVIPGQGGTSVGLPSWPSQIVGVFTTAGTAIDWLLMPSHWVRIICGALGAGMVLGGVWILSHVGGDVT